MYTAISLPKSLESLRSFQFPRKLGILERIYGKRLGNHGICWVVCSNGIKWKLDLSDPCHRWIVFGIYEGTAAIPWGLDRLKNGGVYVDSGANIGQWLLYIGGNPNVKSIAIEPVDTERQWLRQCIDRQDNWDVTILDCGLGENRVAAKMQLDGAKSTTAMAWYKDKGLDVATIQLERLDSLLEKMAVSTVCLWKLDVEGAEYGALKGAKKYLVEKRIKAILFECHPDNFSSITEFLGEVDYQIYTLEQKGPVVFVGKNLENTCNLVALPAES